MTMRAQRGRDAARPAAQAAAASGDGESLASPDSPRVTFVTDIPTPYMLEVLRELSRLVRLTVLFCAASGSRAMPWSLSGDLGFSNQVVGGATIRKRGGDGQDYHVSPRILRALARSRADAVVTFGFSIPSAYAALYSRLRAVPLLIYGDGTHHVEILTLGRHQMLARAFLLRAASGCVALSRPAAERFLELGVDADRVFIAPHSSNLAPLWELARGRRYESREEFRVLIAGRLLPSKGVDLLLRAVARARAERPGLRLVIVGTGPEEGRLRRLAHRLGLDDVEFAGFVEHRRLEEQFAQADAFAFTTLLDSFGIVLLEAAAAGLPVVASPYGGATLDLIHHDESGLIVDPRDTGALTSALVELANDPEKRRRLGHAAHLATLGRSPEGAARGYRAAIEATVGDRRSAVR